WQGEVRSPGCACGCWRVSRRFSERVEGTPVPQMPDYADFPESQRQRIDRRCLEFEDAWKRERPRIVDVIAGAPEEDRNPLFRELLRVELEQRRDQGESPTPEEY